MRKIFIKGAKKNGIFILICTAVFTISIGTMTGCSMTKENAEAVSDQSDQSDQSESENILPVEDSTADDAILENTPVPETSEEKVEKTEKEYTEDKMVLKIMRDGGNARHTFCRRRVCYLFNRWRLAAARNRCMDSCV